TIPTTNTAITFDTLGPSTFEKIAAAGITFAAVFVDHCVNTIMRSNIASIQPEAVSCNAITGFEEPATIKAAAPIMIINASVSGSAMRLPTSVVLFRLNQFLSYFGALKKREIVGISQPNVAQNPIFAKITIINAVNAALPVSGLSAHAQTLCPCAVISVTSV